MKEIVVKTNEKKYIEFVIRDEDMTYPDLTGVVATIDLQKYGTSTLSVSEECDTTYASESKCRWLYNGSLDPGLYKAEVELTFPSGHKLISETFLIRIEKDLPT